MKLVIQSILSLTLLVSCSSNDPQTLIDSVIERHGGDKYNHTHIEFDFRNRHYTNTRNDGIYTYSRTFNDSLGTYRDVLTNDGFTRFLNNETVDLDKEWTQRYSASVNSVIYFALLPYGLNDQSVNKKYLRSEKIRNTLYHLIEITFDQEGGGEDFEDVFYYWIHAQDHTLDFLAYTYDTEEVGVRFREAINRRQVQGIQFQDYINYKPPNIVPLDSLISLFEKGALQELSRIELENINVTLPSYD